MYFIFMSFLLREFEISQRFPMVINFSIDFFMMKSGRTPWKEIKYIRNSREKEIYAKIFWTD